MTNLQPKPDLCDKIEVFQSRHPMIEIYRCQNPKDCEHARPFALSGHVYYCKLAYDSKP